MNVDPDDKILLKITELARTEHKPLANVMLKLMEEVGELAEAINHREGYLAHKTMKETIAGEVADVIQCAITVLVKTYPDVRDRELLFSIFSNLDLKNAKWESLRK